MTSQCRGPHFPGAYCRGRAATPHAAFQKTVRLERNGGSAASDAGARILAHPPADRQADFIPQAGSRRQDHRAAAGSVNGRTQAALGLHLVDHVAQRVEMRLRLAEKRLASKIDLGRPGTGTDHRPLIAHENAPLARDRFRHVLGKEDTRLGVLGTCFMAPILVITGWPVYPRRAHRLAGSRHVWHLRESEESG